MIKTVLTLALLLGISGLAFAQSSPPTCTSPLVLNAAQTACIDPAVIDWSAVQTPALLWVIAWVVVFFMGVRQGHLV